MGRAVRNIAPLKGPSVSEPLTVIILTAGEGSLMKSYGTKSLIKIKDDITILDYQVSLIRKQFINPTIIVVSGFESNKIVNSSPIDIIHIENERYATTSNTRSLWLGLKATITNRVLIIYGDLIFNTATLKHPLENKSLLFIDTSNTMTDNEVGCNICNNCVEHIMYDLPNKWAQIMYLTGKELKIMKQISQNPLNEKVLGFEVINMIINKGGKFISATPSGIKANDIDCTKDILIAQEII